MSDKFEIKKSHAVAVVAGAAILWFLLFRKKSSTPEPAAAPSPDGDTDVTVAYQYPDLPDDFFGDFGGIPSLGNEYFPLFGFVGFRAYY